jgi:hypothetical protein
VTEELMIVDYVSGELIDPKSASAEALAQYMTNVQSIREDLAAAEAIVSDELVARMDRDAKWTLHVGDPKVQVWEITAPSPTAGTEVYPPDVLETELRALVDRGTITVDAADAALKRIVTVKLAVPLSASLSETAQHVKQMMSFHAGDVELRVLDSAHSATVVKAGINALAKVPGTAAALARAKRTDPGGPRRARVKIKTVRS